jgi:hypothetical protein
VCRYYVLFEVVVGNNRQYSTIFYEQFGEFADMKLRTDAANLLGVAPIK